MKRTLILMMMALLLIGSAYASETRVMTLGNNNTIMLDDANIWQFPARLNDYPSIAVGEFHGGNDFAKFGIHWKHGGDEHPWVLATYFDNMLPLEADNLNGGSLLSFDPWPIGNMYLDNRRIHLLYGQNMGNYNFGARLSAYHSSETTDAATDQSKEAFGYYEFGFGLTPSDGSWDLALNLGLGSWTDEDALGAAEAESDGFMDFSLEGRCFRESGPNYTYIPHAGIMYAKRGINWVQGRPIGVGDVTDADLYKGVAFQAGLGMNYTPANGVLALCDFGLMYGKLTHEMTDGDPAVTAEESDKILSLPYFKIGLDAEVFKWMDVRFGAQSNWGRETFEDFAGDKVKWNYAANETWLGFGFHWNRLHIDTYTDPELFLNGFDFISGNGNGDMNFQISATYEMM